MRRVTVAIVLLIFCAFVAFALVRATVLVHPQTSDVRALIVCVTNGAPNAMTTTYVQMNPRNAPIIKAWEAAPTNTVIVKVENDGDTGIWIFPIVIVEGHGAEKSDPRHFLNNPSLLLNAPNFSGLRIPPRATSDVPRSGVGDGRIAVARASELHA